MSETQPPTKPCHNCRRRRLKCDRSYPHCDKCIQTGQECLGYQGLFLWNKGVASRGKMMGKTFEDVKQGSAVQPGRKLGVPAEVRNGEAQRISTYRTDASSLMEPSPCRTLADPLIQDLDWNSRYYLQHCMHLLPLDPAKNADTVIKSPLTSVQTS